MEENAFFFTLNVSNTLTFEVNSKKKNTRTLQYLIDIYVIRQPGGPYWEKLCPKS